MEMPDGLTYWTCDTVAECLSYGKHLPDSYAGGTMALASKLWGFLEDAENPTPLGGDGSNGTVETPAEQLDSRFDDKAPNWWGKLTAIEQTAISAAYNAEYA
jgi:hypothetical protein